MLNLGYAFFIWGRNGNSRLTAEPTQKFCATTAPSDGLDRALIGFRFLFHLKSASRSEALPSRYLNIVEVLAFDFSSHFGKVLK
jgi:hypothetical protein